MGEGVVGLVKGLFGGGGKDKKAQKTSKSTKSSSAGSVPRFAGGTVATKPTFGLFGEYTGAADNPEIVAPQNIMYETVVEANSVLAVAISDFAKQIVTAIKENKPVAIIGDRDIFAANKRGADENKKIVGTT